MKIIRFITLLTCGFLAIQTNASMITNGDFATGDFNGWSKDTDGFGDISTGNDFSITGTVGDYFAVIEVDAFNPPGDFFGAPLDDVWFANTLYQELDLSGASDSTFLLSIDFSVDSEIDSSDLAFFADYFVIGLNDGSGSYFNETGAAGFLFDPTNIDGALSYSLDFTLDNSFANQTGWFLDFQLAVGFDDFGFSDAFASTFILDSVSLTEVQSTDVSEPGSALLFSFGLAGLFLRRRKHAM
jgi:hypothetical protein